MRHIATEGVSRVGDAPSPGGGCGQLLLSVGAPGCGTVASMGSCDCRQHPLASRSFGPHPCVGTGPRVTHSAGSIQQLMLRRAWHTIPRAVHA